MEDDDFDPLFDGDDGDDFTRPFFGAAMAPMAAEEAVDDADLDTRAYLLTGGRTGGGRAGVSIETIVVLGNAGITLDFDTPELTVILDACGDPVAVAEIAATTGLALGVVQVLVGDLVADGVLIRSEHKIAMHDDVAFLERLIDRVSAL